MKKIKLRLGGIRDLQIALGGVDDAGKPKIGRTFASAAKRMAGVSGRYFSIPIVVEWVGNNPNFRVSQVYKHKPQPTASVQPAKSEA